MWQAVAAIASLAGLLITYFINRQNKKTKRGEYVHRIEEARAERRKKDKLGKALSDHDRGRILDALLRIKRRKDSTRQSGDS